MLDVIFIKSYPSKGSSSIRWKHSLVLSRAITFGARRLDQCRRSDLKVGPAAGLQSHIYKMIWCTHNCMSYMRPYNLYIYIQTMQRLNVWSFCFIDIAHAPMFSAWSIGSTLWSLWDSCLTKGVQNSIYLHDCLYILAIWLGSTHAENRKTSSFKLWP